MGRADSIHRTGPLSVAQSPPFFLQDISSESWDTSAPWRGPGYPPEYSGSLCHLKMPTLLGYLLYYLSQNSSPILKVLMLSHFKCEESEIRRGFTVFLRPLSRWVMEPGMTAKPVLFSRCHQDDPTMPSVCLSSPSYSSAFRDQSMPLPGCPGAPPFPVL